MKLSISLSAEDVAVLDAYVLRHGASGRSAAVQQAVALLRAADLVEDYQQAILEWEASPDAALWAGIDAESWPSQ